jgi:hypothetical protein
MAQDMNMNMVPPVPVLAPAQPGVPLAPVPADQAALERRAQRAAAASANFIKAFRLKEYDGSRDPTNWLYTVEQFFDATHMDEAGRVPHAALLLIGNAQTWWRAHKEATRDKPLQRIRAWADFAAALTAQYRPTNVPEVARYKLRYLRQTHDVRNYVAIFRATCLDIPDLAEAEMLDKFVTGLKPAILREIKLRKPIGFEATVAMAEELDQLERTLRATTGRPSGAFTERRPFGRFTGIPSGPVPMEIGALRIHPRSGGQRGAARPQNPRTRMDPARQQRLRQDGLCFHCEKPGHMARDCPAKTSGNGQRAPQRH